MAVTALLVFQRSNRLRYRLTQDGQAGTTLTITTTGAVSPDLLTDTLGGKLKAIAKAFTAGYGQFGPGAMNQAQARGLWMARGHGASDQPLMYARCMLANRTGATAPGWIIDANVDGSGHPTLNITAQAGAGVAYLDVELEGGAIGA